MSEAIKELTIACNRVLGKSMALNFFTGEDAEKIIEISEAYTEIFPNVQMRAIFNKEGGGNTFVLKAKAGSKIDVHKVLPSRFIYVAYGEHKEPITGKVYREGDEYHVEANGMCGADFTQDSKLIMEVGK